MVPADFTFHRFHEVIQAVFGWDDYHLYQFLDTGYDCEFAITLPEEDGRCGFSLVEEIDSSKVKLSRFFGKTYNSMLYVYDFGDNWVHRITLEAIGKEKPDRAVCLAGKGACPPEDCGGVGGYQELKDAFATDPEGEEAKNLREWLMMDEDESWDPKAFNVEAANSWLKSV